MGAERLGVLWPYNLPAGVGLAAEGDGPDGSNTLLAGHPETDAIVIAFTNTFGLAMSWSSRFLMLLLAAAARPAAGQAPPAPDSAKAPPGAELLLPIGSFVLPGLGQYVQGAPLAGLGFSTTAVLGVAISQTGNPVTPALGGLPRKGDDQLANQGAHLTVTAGALSAYDAFRRAIPALQREGKYRFLPRDETVGDLLSAPFDVRFLSRWTTWLDLGYTAAVVGLVLGQRDDGVGYEPFRWRDAPFVTSLSFNAAVGEEAWFRGWLLPLFHQNLGKRFWVANGLQAAIFAGLHVPQAEEVAVAIGAWALYEGWLVRRNDWSIRESVFHHFWYDVAVVTATLLLDETPEIQLTFPAIRF